MFLRSLLIVLVSAITAQACQQLTQTEINRKKIRPVLHRVMGMAQDDDAILFTILLKRDVDNDIEKRILALDVEIERYIDNYMVLRGTKEQIYKVCDLDFIYVLEGTSQRTFRKTYRKGTYELEIE